MTADPGVALETWGLRKRFGNFTALDGVSLRLRAGSVHALLGENGAGKSTLVKCIMGYHRPDAGQIAVGGRNVTVRSPREAQALGIGMVYQHFTVIPNMTVAENLVLARARLPFFIDWKQERAALRTFFTTVPFALPLDAPVRSLSAGERQKLEIVKQLYLRSQIVILDEPTSVLTPAEADEVLGVLQRMTREAELSVLMITHKFREVTAFADDVTVLRRGQLAGTGAVCDLSPDALATMMMGAPPKVEKRGTRVPASGAPVLRVDGLSADDELGMPALGGVSFDVRPGEIVGIAAIAGNGQEELVETLAGQRPRSGGTIHIHGQEYTPSRAEMRTHGVRCLPEDPLRSACVPGMSVAENIALRSFDVPPFAVGRWFVSSKAVAAQAEDLVRAYSVRTRSVATSIGELSGGNVQRAVLARELTGAVSVLVVANPCMGLDFEAVAEIHRRIEAARAAGAAILLVSADLDEILTLADRVLVLSEGRIVHETTATTADVRTIGARMAGHAHAEAA